MAVPKKRTSKSRKGMRRAHDFIQYKSATTICECGALKRAHHVCPVCGTYRGIQLLKLKGRSDDAEGMVDSDDGAK
jgi:large subunit ribosomal protein L32